MDTDFINRHLASLSLDEVYTAVANMLLSFCFRDLGPDQRWLILDLVGAVADLREGPWRHVGGTVLDFAQPLEVELLALGALLDRLERSCGDESGRSAVARVRRHLADWPIPMSPVVDGS